MTRSFSTANQLQGQSGPHAVGPVRLSTPDPDTEVTPVPMSAIPIPSTYNLPVNEKSIQETWAPQNRCFGCGPSNDKGLRIRSFREGDEFVCDWTPEPHHAAFDNVLNGGITGALLDCHSNWAATMVLMERNGSDAPPCTVTSDFHVVLKRPTPMSTTLHIRARVVEVTDDRATVESSLEANGKVTATCKGTFVAVKEGHPAYHRW